MKTPALLLASLSLSLPLPAAPLSLSAAGGAGASSEGVASVALKRAVRKSREVMRAAPSRSSSSSLPAARSSLPAASLSSARQEEDDDAAALRSSAVVAAPKGFEVKYYPPTAANDCSNDPMHVLGRRFNVCTNYIDMSPNEVDKGGYARSHNFVFNETTGFTDYQAFVGHRCKQMPVYKMSYSVDVYGLPSDYTVGDCFTVFDGTTAQYNIRADFVQSPTKPTYPHIVDGVLVKDRHCNIIDRPRYDSYDIEQVYFDMCHDDEDDNGNVVYFKWDLTNCASGTWSKVMYSDDTCSTQTSTKGYATEVCFFDHDAFADGFQDYNTSYFEYRHQDCFVPANPL